VYFFPVCVHRPNGVARPSTTDMDERARCPSGRSCAALDRLARLRFVSVGSTTEAAGDCRVPCECACKCPATTRAVRVCFVVVIGACSVASASQQRQWISLSLATLWWPWSWRVVVVE
jgi:hypothetical protein